MGERLALERERAFAGRRDALTRCLRAASLDVATPVVLFVDGGAGLGKTMLLMRVVDELRRRGQPVVWVDVAGHGLAALTAAVADLASRPAGTPEALVVVDDWDLLAGVEPAALAALAELPARALALVAGRRPPSLAWAKGGGWSRLVERVSLAPFDAAESDEALARLAVPPALRAGAAAFAEGSPILLGLAAGLLRARGAPLGEDDARELLAHAHELFRSQTPPADEALAALVVAPAVTLAHLDALLGQHGAPAALARLRALPFVSASPRGLVADRLFTRTYREELRRYAPALLARVEGVLAAGAPAATNAAAVGEPGEAAAMPATAELSPVETSRPGDGALGALLQTRVRQLGETAGLSPRELQVLELVLLGRNHAEIGMVLGISARTAKFHQANVLRKLGADSRLDLLRVLQ